MQWTVHNSVYIESNIFFIRSANDDDDDLDDDGLLDYEFITVISLLSCES